MDYGGSLIPNLKEVRVVDPRTVDFVLGSVDPTFLTVVLPLIPILSRHSIEAAVAAFDAATKGLTAKGAAQQPPDGGMAAADVVEARVDDAVVDEAHRLAGEEAAEAAPRVGAHVRCEAVAQRVGQPVDERDVAEDVALAEVGAVRLEGIQAVGREDHDGAAGLRHAHHLGDGARGRRRRAR